MSLACLLMIAALLPDCISLMDTPPKVVTRNGVVVGQYVESRGGRKVAAFMGIPYAKPPIGDLRFEPPHPVDPWEGELDCSVQGPSCIQFFMTTGQLEDCLYINVYRPEVFAGKKLPVMFWIFGGQYLIGAGDHYNPKYLMDEDVVFVSFNYRLGLFGFLSTGDKVIPGNMGLKDIREALRWVQNNIHYFGGNPNRVTIFGESAGSASVHYLMSFLADEGLFHAAICQSGVSMTPWAFRPPDQVKDELVDLVAKSGCPKDSKGFIKCLRQKTAVEILQLSSVPDDQGGFDFNAKHSPSMEPACVEDRIVTDNPWRIRTDIPWMVGVNSLESLYYLVDAINDKTGVQFMEKDRMFDEKLLLYGNYEYSSANGSSVPSPVRQMYLNNQPVSRSMLVPTAQILSDVYFIYPSYEAACRGKRSKTYFYHYEYVGPNMSPLLPVLPTDRVGASHAEELLMLYPLSLLDQSETILSKVMVKLWTNFATYQNPTPFGSRGGLDWQPFSTEENYLVISKEGLGMRPDFLKDRMTFWREHPFPYRDDDFRTAEC